MSEEAKLFVAGLPDSMSEDVLKGLFESFGGTVLNVSLPKDRVTGRLRGFGFVTFSSPAEAQAARDSLDGSIQGGKSISVRPAEKDPPKRGDGPPGSVRGPRINDEDRKLFVGNLPFDCAQQDLEEVVNKAAGEAGTVTHVTWPTGPDGRRRGFAFVVMSTVDAAKNAVAGLQTTSLRGRPLKVNMAQPKGDRPPRSDSFGGGFAGGGGGFAGGGGGFAGGGGGGFSGPPPGAGSGPPQSRRTFDDKKRKNEGSGEGGRPKQKERGGGGSSSRFSGGGGGRTGGGWEKDD